MRKVTLSGRSRLEVRKQLVIILLSTAGQKGRLSGALSDLLRAPPAPGLRAGAGRAQVDQPALVRGGVRGEAREYRGHHRLRADAETERVTATT